MSMSAYHFWLQQEILRLPTTKMCFRRFIFTQPNVNAMLNRRKRKQLTQFNATHTICETQPAKALCLGAAPC